jgi:hypothetical protein
MHRSFYDYIVYGYVSTDSADDNALFSALQHLRHNKHKVVLFHVVTPRQNSSLTLIIPRKFIDVETGETVVFF